MSDDDFNKDARIAELEEALRWYADQYCERWCKGTGRRAVFEDHCGGCRARAVLEKGTTTCSPD